MFRVRSSLAFWTLSAAFFVSCAGPRASLQRTALNGQVGQVSAESLSLTRDGEVLEVSERLEFYTGDVIETKATQGAVIAFPQGASMVLRERTQVSLPEGSVAIQRGHMLFRPDGENRRITAPGLTVLPEAAVVIEQDGGATKVTALDRAVGVEIPQKPTVRLEPMQMLVATEAGGTDRRELQRDELNQIVEWANGIDMPARRLIPDVTGMQHAAADAVLVASGVNCEVVKVPVTSDQVGVIQAQSPARGATGQAVKIDLGAESILVADVVNLSLAEARRRLADVGSVTGKIDQRLSAQRDEPTVVDQQPKQGTRVLRGAAVHLAVEYPASVVPTVRNMVIAQAIESIRGVRLRGVEADRGYYASVAEGHVVRTAPGSGTLVPRGSEVRLLVSLGPLPPPGLLGPGDGSRAECEGCGAMTFQWSRRPEATDYQLRLKHPQGGVIFDREIPGNLTQYRSGFRHGDNAQIKWRPDWSSSPYSWQMRARTNGEWGEWSQEQSFTYEPPDIPLPRLVGLSLSGPDFLGATRFLNVEPREEWSDEPVGAILRADDQARLKPRDRLVVVVSKGPDPDRPLPLPDLVGRLDTDAPLVVADAKLGVDVGRRYELVARDSGYNRDVPKGHVMRMDPSAGTEIRRGARVVIYVSPGRDPYESGTLFGGSLTVLGRGYDIFADHVDRMVKGQIYLFDDQSRDVKLGWFSDQFSVPTNIDAKPTGKAYRSTKDVHESAEEAQRDAYRSVGLDVEVGNLIGGFSASVRSKYGEQTMNKANRYFVEYSLIIEPMRLAFMSGEPRRLSRPVAEQLKAMEGFTYKQNPAPFDAFIAQHGSHFVSEVAIGAHCTMNTSVTKTSGLTRSSLENKVEAAVRYKIAEASGSYESNNAWSDFSRSANESTEFLAYGGNPGVIDGGRSLNRYQDWIASTKSWQDGGLVEVGKSLRPIYEIATNPTVAQGLREALQKHAKKGRWISPEVSSQPEGSSLYLVRGGDLYWVDPVTGNYDVLGTRGAWMNTDRMCTVGDRIYFTGNGGLYQADPRSGISQRAGVSGWRPAAAMCSTGGKVYIAESDTLYVYDPSAQSHRSVGSSPWRGVGGMCALGGALYVCENNRLFRVDLGTEQHRQLGQADWGNVQGMCLLDGLIYILKDWQLMRIDPVNGAVMRVGQRSWAGVTGMCGLHRKLYLAGRQGLIEYDPYSGQERRLQGDWAGTVAMTAIAR